MEASVGDATYPMVRKIDGRIYVTMWPEAPEQGAGDDVWRRLHAGLSAALSAAPAPEGVPIRAAVGVVRIGDDPPDVYVWGRTGASDATAMRAIDTMAIGAVVSRMWITAVIAPPVVAEIAATVQPVGGE
jgi:hypothetical protein